jgi:hypothetical protein
MSGLMNFLPAILENSALLQYAATHLRRLSRDTLPKHVVEQRHTDLAIQVVILDGPEWHLGATAPRISLPAYAGKAGDP